MLKVRRFSSNAILPKKSHKGDAGFDLYSVENIEILPNSFKLVSTGLGFSVPNETYGRIAPRSSVSMKGIIVNAGVIDRSYCGVVKVLLMNMSSAVFQVNEGDRIAQLIIEKIVDNCDIVEVKDLEDSSRGEGGFGSTGI